MDTVQCALDETGARRLLDEYFSRKETRLFSSQVVPEAAPYLSRLSR
jgi:hypothetical protein